MHAGLPPHVLLVLDAAYAEYVVRNDYTSGLELAATFDNVVMTRTFSKIHGLASLRIGWMYAPEEICDIVNRIRGPFNVSGPRYRGGHRRHQRQPAYRNVGGAQREMAQLAERRSAPPPASR